MRDRQHEYTQRELDRMVCDKKLHKIVGTLFLVEDTPITIDFTEDDRIFLATCNISAD